VHRLLLVAIEQFFLICQPVETWLAQALGRARASHVRALVRARGGGSRVVRTRARGRPAILVGTASSAVSIADSIEMLSWVGLS
jgi:hypothetical protein